MSRWMNCVERAGRGSAPHSRWIARPRLVALCHTKHAQHNSPIPENPRRFLFCTPSKTRSLTATPAAISDSGTLFLWNRFRSGLNPILSWEANFPDVSSQSAMPLAATALAAPRKGMHSYPHHTCLPHSDTHAYCFFNPDARHIGWQLRLRLAAQDWIQLTAFLTGRAGTWREVLRHLNAAHWGDCAAGLFAILKAELSIPTATSGARPSTRAFRV